MNSEEIMEHAIALALKNIQTNCGGPFAAVVVKDGEIIAECANHVTTQHDPTAHAEVVAIRNACKKLGTFQLDGCEIYTTCEPCPMCMGAIYWARLDAVFYACDQKDAADAGFDDQFIYDEIAVPYEKRKIPFKKLHQQQARTIFARWVEMEDKVRY